MTTTTVDLPRFERDHLSRVRATYPTRQEIQAAELAKLRAWRRKEAARDLVAIMNEAARRINQAFGR